MPTAQRTDHAEKLISDNLGLVSSMVQQIAVRYPGHVDRGELWSAGALGLVEAAGRFDPAMGIPFERYAAIRIQGAIIDSTRSRDWATRRIRRHVRELQEAEASIRVDGRAVDDNELAAVLGCTVERIRELRAEAETSSLLSLDWAPDSGGEPLAGQIPEGDLESMPEDRLVFRELVGTLRTAVQHLPPVQREVIERYYMNDEILATIADDLGVTVARVSQIRSEAINAMRSYLSGLYKGVPEVDDSLPGLQARTRYAADLAAHSTWRSRLEAGQDTTSAVAS